MAFFSEVASTLQMSAPSNKMAILGKNHTYLNKPTKQHRTRLTMGVQIRSKDSLVTTQPVLWIFNLFKVTTGFGIYHQAIIRSQVNNRI
jgi:hypothetical protein